ncbi:histamine H2 receptor-like [Amphiura filiformis]|uniref:histamine H2 receptor-like n=1 Tax=Amphiura filiformis TaxID=82378 RepID=UPI003B2125DF
MKAATKVFTISLAITDFCVGLFSITSIVSSALDRWPFGATICWLNTDWDAALCSISVFFYSCLGIDRLIEVQKPLRYRQIMTRKRAQWIAILIWVLSIAFYVVLVRADHQVEYGYQKSTAACTYIITRDVILSVIGTLSISFYIPVIIASFIYIKLLRVSRQHIQRIKKIMPTGPPPRRQGSILMFTIAMLADIIAWTPYSVLVVYELCSGQRAPSWVEFGTNWLLMSTSWWNVVIYARSNRSWRETAVVILKKCLNRNQEYEIQSCIFPEHIN